jgi:hypothetical protein
MIKPQGDFKKPNSNWVYLCCEEYYDKIYCKNEKEKRELLKLKLKFEREAFDIAWKKVKKEMKLL